MQTLIIFSDFQALPRFYLVDGDYRHLDGVLVNLYIESNKTPEGDEKKAAEEKKQDELNELFYDENGIPRFPEFASLEEAFGALKFGASLCAINCGFMP